MRQPPEPTTYEIWFYNWVMTHNSLEKLNSRQWKIIEKVRKWFKWGKITEKKERRLTRKKKGVSR